MKPQKRLFIRPQTAINTAINVTPLVDVVLVLLIIFMVVTPLLEKDIPVRTPTSEKVEEQTEVPPDQIVVYMTEQGDVRINSERVSSSDFVSRLKQRLESKAEHERVVFLIADDKLNYGKFVAIIDRTKQAGATVLGFATDPPEPGLLAQ